MDEDNYYNQELQHGSFFDCPICWACFYEVPHIDSANSSRRCPVCMGDVPDIFVIPILYGEDIDENQRVCKRTTKSGMAIPLRPRALLVGCTDRTLSILVKCLLDVKLSIARMAHKTAQDLSRLKSIKTQIPQRMLIERVLSHDARHLTSVSTTVSSIHKILVELLDTMTNNGAIPLNQQHRMVVRCVRQYCSSSSSSKGDTCESGRIFYCYICLDKPREPILTCCGHLFCWECFYLVPRIYSCRKCPVCKGDVPDSAVFPIYSSNGEEDEQRVRKRIKYDRPKIPSRPKAHGVESRSPTLFAIVQQLRQLRMNVGRMCNVTAEDVSFIEMSQEIRQSAKGPQGKSISHYLEVISYMDNVLTTLPTNLSGFEKRLVEQLDMIFEPSTCCFRDLIEPNWPKL